MDDLAERIEAAGVDAQRAMLADAFAYIHKMDDGLAPSDWSALNWPFADRFTAMLDAEAYESAAMMLVPEGWRPYTLDMSVKGRSRWSLEGPKTKWETDDDGMPCAGDDWFAQGIAATPDLALSAAAIRAGAK